MLIILAILIGWFFLPFSRWIKLYNFARFCQTPVLGLGLGVDFTFTLDNNNKNNNKNKNNYKNKNNNPYLNFLKGTVVGDKAQGVGIRDKG